MQHLEFPNKETWHRRNDWFNDQIERKMTGFSYLVSEQASALNTELCAVYCCGAWYTVIILSVSIIDAQLRDCEMPDHIGSTYDLAKKLQFNEDFDWLRKRRNKLVHIDLDNPIANMDDYYTMAEDLERDAQRAIEIVLDAFFYLLGHKLFLIKNRIWKLFA